MNYLIKNKNFYNRCLGSILLLLFSVLGINGQTVNLGGNQSINGFKRFNSGLFFGIDSSAQLPLGTDKPYTRFGIVYDPATNSELPSSFTPTTYAFNDQGLTTIVTYNGAVGEPRLTLNKARGTLTNPLNVQIGDVLGKIMFRPFQGSDYLPSVFLMSTMTGNTENMYTNANLTFNIRKNGNTNVHNLDNFLELHPNGNIYLPQVPPNLSSTGEILLRNSQSGAIEKSSYSNFVQNIMGLGSAAYSDKTKFWAKSPWENSYYIEHGWDGTGWNLYAANNASDEQANIHKVNINGNAASANLWGGRTADWDSYAQNVNVIAGKGLDEVWRVINSAQLNSFLGLGASAFKAETLASVIARNRNLSNSNLGSIYGIGNIFNSFKPSLEFSHSGVGFAYGSNIETTVVYGYNFGGSPVFRVVGRNYTDDITNPFNANDNVFLEVQGGGNVGIGTTNPSSLLDVRGRITVPEIAFALNGSDDSDPYRLRKVQSSPNVNWLELQLNDDYNESFRIYGNSCEGFGCVEYSNNLYHSFDASGNVFHKGNVGIGLMNSSDRLTVNGAVKFTATSNPELAYTKISWNTVGDGKSVFDNHKDLGNGGFTFRTTNNNTSYSELLNINMSGIQVYGGQAGSTIKGGDLGVGSAIVNFIKSDNISALYLRGDGNIGIGTTNPGTDRLAVNGNIKAKAVKVDPNAWPDYVFETNYPLLSLKDTEAFIQKNKHLPEVPSASEVAEKGHDLGEMNTILLKKVEELTLHLIDLKKNYEELKSELDKLKPVHDEKNKQP